MTKAIDGLSGLDEKCKRQLLASLVGRATHTHIPARDGLIVKLQSALPVSIGRAELASVLRILRGPQKQLSDAAPWILRDMLVALIESGPGCRNNRVGLDYGSRRHMG
ncbi:hypothetical protein [Paraburkholderia rhynchosiae]|uniref:hypothetical protein n=1 Tax=Paraburkholderia rhynchosiae TaxID=487049 RepID=UPI0011AFB0F8|nr:hypothetical protein [Paraburkholderia rhynchosiae]